MGTDPFEPEVHFCIGRREGHLFIYECPHCDYKVVFDEQKDAAGKMTRSGGAPFARHVGNYISPLAGGLSDN